MTLVDAPAITIGSGDLALDDLVAIAYGAPVVLDDDAWATIEASRAIVDRIVDGPTLVYGLNTGLGHQRDVALPRDSLRRIQALVVRAHEGGLGEPLPSVVVRAAMAARVNGIARGGTGASRPVSDWSICCAWVSARSCSPSCACVDTRPFSTSCSFESTRIKDSRNGWTMASSALWRPSRSVEAARWNSPSDVRASWRNDSLFRLSASSDKAAKASRSRPSVFSRMPIFSAAAALTASSSAPTRAHSWRAASKSS